MTEILLVNTNREKGPMPVLPIGLCQLASAVARAGIPCKVVDLCFAKNPLVELGRAIHAERPRLIGVTIRNVDNCDYQQPVYYLPYIRQVIERIREVTDVPVVIGGTGTSLAPQRVLDAVGADLAVAGPGEEVFVHIYRRLVEGGEALADLPRIQHGKRVPLNDSNGPQFARWLDMRPYKKQAVPISVQSRRGCPFRCVYCEYAHIEGGSAHELFEVEQVVESIDRAVRTTGIQLVEFIDSTFNAPPSYTMELCEALSRHRVARAYHASGINPRFGGKEVLTAMKNAGFTAVYCSPDAAAEGTIKGYRKDFTMEQLSALARDTSELDLAVLWSFIIGGPGETPETLRETLRFIREEIDPNQTVMLTPRMRIYPGSALLELAREEGYPPNELDPRMPGQFYLSDQITMEEVDATLQEAFSTIGNVMSISAAQLRVTYWLQRINAITGHTKPNWKVYPGFRKWQRRLHIPWS